MHLRLDLDGVPLADEHGRVTALFRFRTRDGLLLKLPESIDVFVPWALVAGAALDLCERRLEIRFTPEGTRELRWLSGARVLAGEWTDRGELDAPPPAVRGADG